ncbi:MAG TPA: hypothetical protein DCW29_03400 [Janthinobacterium sp.]|nr:hypothetical protein [Janthinobacterium sp.]
MKKTTCGVALAISAAFVPALSHADILVSVNLAPPALPVYAQPPIPGNGYLWTPGFWSWDDYDQDYYWVPGTWVRAPYVGALWTPGYWGWRDGGYFMHDGYWGTRVGYYGGINYGYGYVGNGYQGGRWDNRQFNYNRSVNNINNVHITNVYNTTVINNVNTTRVSYNGGNGGVRQQETRAEMDMGRMRHTGATPQQFQHQRAASANPDLRASFNHGVPAIAATRNAGKFDARHGITAGTGPAQGPWQGGANPRSSPVDMRAHRQDGASAPRPAQQAERTAHPLAPNMPQARQQDTSWQRHERGESPTERQDMRAQQRPQAIQQAQQMAPRPQPGQEAQHMQPRPQPVQEAQHMQPRPQPIQQQKRQEAPHPQAMAPAGPRAQQQPQQREHPASHEEHHQQGGQHQQAHQQ